MVLNSSCFTRSSLSILRPVSTTPCSNNLPRACGRVPGVFPDVLALDLEPGLRGDGVDDKVVVAVGAIFVALLKLLCLLAEALLALFAGKDHLGRLLQRVVGRLLVALGAVKPLLAAGAADGDLGVEDVLAGRRQREEAIGEHKQSATYHMARGVWGCVRREIGLVLIGIRG